MIRARIKVGGLPVLCGMFGPDLSFVPADLRGKKGVSAYLQAERESAQVGKVDKLLKTHNV